MLRRFWNNPWLIACIPVVLLGMHIASFGPVLWLIDRYDSRRDIAIQAYRPLFWAIHQGPTWVSSALNAYGRFWTGVEWTIWWFESGGTISCSLIYRCSLTIDNEVETDAPVSAMEAIETSLAQRESE